MSRSLSARGGRRVIERLSNSRGKLKEPNLAAALEDVNTNWFKQPSSNQTDHIYKNIRDSIASNDFLRRIPEHAFYRAADKNGVTIFFHYPNGLQAAYGEAAVKRFYQDIETYLLVEPPMPPGKPCHSSRDQMLNPYPESNIDNGDRSGTIHVGCRHGAADQHAENPLLLKTSQSLPYTATQDAMLGDLQYGTLGHITRAINIWFGVVNHNLRGEYAWIVQNIPSTRRMDTTNDETFTLLAILCDTVTESKRDASGWIAGSTWTTPLGHYQGEVNNPQGSW